MLDETTGFFIIIVLIAILLLWPILSASGKKYMSRGCERSNNEQACDLTVEKEGLETKSPQPQKLVPYSELIQNMALEKSVSESHKRFITDAPHRTTVSSSDTERDDPNDINPWIGLRRPKYYDNVASNQPASRVVSSESPLQMPVYKKVII